MSAVPIPADPRNDSPQGVTSEPANFPRVHQQPVGIASSLNDLREFLADDGDEESIIGQSAVLHQVFHLAARYAQSSAPVLISGESGTGKELIARRIHQLSDRSRKPYLQINCAALSESLIESELFGHEKGSFTGADCARPGKFESADGGSLLLDEIGEMPGHLQSKMLRVLEQFEFQRVGGNQSIPVNTRIIATTNRTLANEVRDGSFRLDLFHRLNVLTLTIPPLRERCDDIPMLVSAFISRFQCEASVPIHSISHQAMQELIRREWPGNVRELRNAIRHSCVVNSTGCIELADLPDDCGELEPPVIPFRPPGDMFASLADDLNRLPLEEIEQRVILAALEHFDGNKTAAARHLGITARTISNKLRRNQKSS